MTSRWELRLKTKRCFTGLGFRVVCGLLKVQIFVEKSTITEQPSGKQNMRLELVVGKRINFEKMFS